MKGDFTRFTFRPDNQYTSVRLQQGRVSLDADWNEQVDLMAYQTKTAQAAFFGDSGTPKAKAGFKVGYDSKSGLWLTPGRYFVGGLLCELSPSAADASVGVTYKDQPFYPGAPALSSLTVGSYLIYLDVWTRHVTALEDPRLREVALSGPDTTTRTQTVWQLRLLKLDQPLAQLDSANLATRLPESTVKLAARARSLAPATVGALQPPGSGYLRPDNHLYRVEVHQGGRIGQDAVTLKCSRDNGSVCAAWLSQTGNSISVSAVPLDEERGFSVGSWIELTDDGRELRAEPGILCQVTGIEGPSLTVAPPAGVTIDRSKFGPNPKVRRWDVVIAPPISQTVGTWLPIEDGIEVQLAGTTCRCGDYWVIPARTATRDIEWPRQGTEPALVTPAGICHAYADLATATWDGTQLKDIVDRRLIFPSLSDLRNVDPVKFNQLLTTHRHTGDADGSLIPREGIVDGAVNGAKIATDADVRIASLSASGTLKAGGDTELGSMLMVRGPDLRLDNPSARGGRDGVTRRALVHDDNDTLTLNDGRDYSSGVKVSGQLFLDGKLALCDNHLRLRNPQDRNHGITYSGSSTPFAGNNVDGPVMFGYSGGALGTAQCQATEVDGSVYLTGGGYIDIPDFDEDFSGGITVEAWVRYDSLGNWSRILDFGNGAPSDNIVFANDGTSTTLRLNLHNGTSVAATSSVSGALLATGSWMHVCAIIDGSGNGKIFKNGAQVGKTITGLARPTKISRTSCFIGKSNWSSDAGFNGRIARLRIWNRALSAEQVSDAYSAQRPPDTTGLVGFWRLDDGSGTVARDASGKGRHGTLIPGSTASAFETYQKVALSWDSGRSVSVGNNLTVENNITLGNYLSVGGRMAVRGSDFVLDNTERRGGNNTGGRIALVHDVGDKLHVNYAGEYSGGTQIGGNTTVSGKLRSGNSKTSASTSNGTVMSYSYNSSAFSDIDGMSLSTVWMSTGTLLIMVTIGGVQTLDVASARAYFQVVYQATGASSWTTLSTSIHEWNVAGMSLRDVQMHALVSLNGGSYNFKVQCRNDTSGSSLKIGYYGSHRTLSVIELA